MVKLTRAQRLALKQLFDRGPVYTKTLFSDDPEPYTFGPLTYYQFRRNVKLGIDCIMIYWCGMWIGIEMDGYTHS